MRVVAEFAEHPGTQDGSQAGLGQIDLSVRLLAKIRLHLPLEDLDLLIQGDDHRDQGPDGGSVGGGDGRRLPQLGAAQRGHDGDGLAGDVAAAGALSAAEICARVSFATRAGSGALASSSRFQRVKVQRNAAFIIMFGGAAQVFIAALGYAAANL